MYCFFFLDFLHNLKNIVPLTHYTACVFLRFLQCLVVGPTPRTSFAVIDLGLSLRSDSAHNIVETMPDLQIDGATELPWQILWIVKKNWVSEARKKKI
jgi:hypothetical protein